MAEVDAGRDAVSLSLLGASLGGAVLLLGTSSLAILGRSADATKPESASIIPLVRRVFRRPSQDNNDDNNNNNKKGENHNHAKRTTGQRQPSGGHALMNATEYALGKSRALMQRIRASARGGGWFLGGFAAVAVFVLSVLYVFENEVSLRVAKTVSKRLKRLAAKVERGGGGGGRAEAQIDEKDLAVLQQGWRWRVLTWNS